MTSFGIVFSLCCSEINWGRKSSSRTST